MDDAVRYWCIECDVSYKCEDKFSKHYNQMHTFTCDLCEVCFTKDINLKRHIESHHKSNPEPTVVERDEKHDEEDDDTEAKDDISARLVKPKKQEQSV